MSKLQLSVAMGDYFMDLEHGRTAQAIEPDLDAGEAPKGGGPFQVPFEAFIPEKLDGFLPAEKNISQSRLANGATRLVMTVNGVVVNSTTDTHGGSPISWHTALTVYRSQTSPQFVARFTNFRTYNAGAS